MEKDFQICISILIYLLTYLVVLLLINLLTYLVYFSKFISKFCILVRKILSGYFHKSVFLVKSRLIFNAFYYRHATQKCAHTKINTYSNEMNAYKDFHIFACISVIKTCITGLVFAISHSCS